MMFDSIHCKMSLPEGTPEYFKENPYFQTYDLGCWMGDYVITEEGRLQMQNSLVSNVLMENHEDVTPITISYKRKRIEMYATNLRGGAFRDGKYVNFTDGGVDCIEITLIVQIRSGKVSSIKEKSRFVKPAIDYKLF